MAQVTNLGQFTKEVSDFAFAVPGKGLELQKKIAFDLLTKIVMRTPVGNPSLWKNPKRAPKGYVGGRARANWQVNVVSPDASRRVGTAKRDAAGSDTIISGLARISSARPGGVIWLYNNLPYIVRLEYGWSTQAPGGMLRLSLSEIEAQFARSV